MKQNREIKKILLVDPPRTAPEENLKRTRPTVQSPLGILYVAAVLEKNGYEVKILDAVIEAENPAVPVVIEKGVARFGLNDKEIESYIREFAPDVIGVSCVLSVKYNDARNICKIAKKYDPDCPTIMGGGHPTQYTTKVLQDPNLDYVVIGEGEFSTLELIQYLEGEISLNALDGIGMKNDGKVKIIPKTKFIENLDDIPFPARHLVPMEKYSKVNMPHGETTRTPWATIFTSRGCPASCFYCGSHVLWGRRYRGRSAENVLEEIKSLIDDFGIKELLIEDDNFTYEKKRTGKILDKIIKNNWDLTWTTPSGTAIFALDEELLIKIKESGCVSLTLAIESGSQRVLSKVIKKPLSLEKAKHVVKKAKSLGIKTRAFFMLGIPGETKEEMEQTVELARELKIDWACFNITTPMPGTQLYDICLDEQYIDQEIDPVNIEYTNARIKTDEFSEQYVSDMWEKGNSINFLENPNMESGGNIDRAINDFKRVIRIVPNHEMAHAALEKAYKKKEERSWDPVWEEVFKTREWGKYPPIELVRFIARNYYKISGRKDVRILDIGCGTGAATWYLAREGFCASGIDASMTAVDIAGKRCRKEQLEAEFKVGDIIRLDYENECFNCVVDINAIQHNTIEKIKIIIDEAFRVLKPGGKIFSIMMSEGCRFDEKNNPLEDKGTTSFVNSDTVQDLFSGFKNIVVEKSEYTDRGNFISNFIIHAEKGNN